MGSERKSSILLVDDDDNVRTIVHWLLEDAGYTVFTRPSGPDALGFLDEHGPVDVVLSDVDMPQMDGIQLQNELKSRWPSLPVLLISGRPPPPDASAFMAKPFDFCALLEWLEHLKELPKPSMACA